MKDATRAYQDALKTYRSLSASKAGMYSPDVAMTLTSLGDLYLQQNQTKNARKAYEEAVKILAYRGLASSQAQFKV